MKKYLDKKGIMSKYEEEMFESIVDSCSKMYAEGKSWVDLEVFVEGIIIYNEELFLDINYKELLDQIYSYYLIHVNLKLKDYTI